MSENLNLYYRAKYKKIAILTLVLITSIGLYAQRKDITYYDNGQVRKQGQYDIKNQKTGEWKRFHKNGQLKKIWSYNGNCERTGKFKAFHENGELESKGKWNDGNQIGKWKY